MTSQQLPISFGKMARNAGIKRAVKHANAVHANWSDQAYRFFRMFIAQRSAPFMIEDFRASVAGVLPEPPSKRSFGALPLKAAREGLIRKVGTTQVKNEKAHMANAAVWQKVYP